MPSKSNIIIETLLQSSLFIFNMLGSEKKKKRYRPFAAIRERERLAVMNSALKELKKCLPLDNHEQKLSKKQILVAAAIYIKRLSETLDHHHESNSRTEEETVNLDKHNYIVASQ